MYIVIHAQNGRKPEITFKKDDMRKEMREKVKKLETEIRALKIVHPELARKADNIINDLIHDRQSGDHIHIGSIEYFYVREKESFFIHKKSSTNDSVRFMTTSEDFDGALAQFDIYNQKDPIKFSY